MTANKISKLPSRLWFSKHNWINILSHFWVPTKETANPVLLQAHVQQRTHYHLHANSPISLLLMGQVDSVEFRRREERQVVVERMEQEVLKGLHPKRSIRLVSFSSSKTHKTRVCWAISCDFTQQKGASQGRRTLKDFKVCKLWKISTSLGASSTFSGCFAFSRCCASQPTITFGLSSSIWLMADSSLAFTRFTSHSCAFLHN